MGRVLFPLLTCTDSASSDPLLYSSSKSIVHIMHIASPEKKSIHVYCKAIYPLKWHKPRLIHDSPVNDIRKEEILDGAERVCHVLLVVCCLKFNYHIGLHMGPNNLYYVARHFLFFLYVATSLFIRHQHDQRHFLQFL